ncbi:class I SAM-dependent methyltransferase [Cupriavidus sp. UYPR2.512]|uniref:class I SAM-dependent methyltransferase n=1 Tax=Cupriavidus sp. UYPR2.512 TaxID=1080187 RepID=UPI00039D33E5|nr:class I SAM-dependent methyltransferase [Cupriavidus sp. UYPR2.512]UIF86318.1 class I SAM-dependent methyltransferase [Cupriavidus necator]
MDVQQQTRSIGGDQAALWNGPSGHAWVAEQTVLDDMLRPLEGLLVDTVGKTSAQRVLDVGCGTGSTTIALARKLGTLGRCTGIDISEPMLAAARARAQHDGSTASFIRADAQDYAFAPASFDSIVSRLGVMFFSDPVRAFANLRQAATPDATLHCIAWRSAAENPFMTTAERAAAPLLSNLPPRQPGAPGQFAFGDRQRVQAILEAGGWTGIDIQPVELACTLPEPALVDYLSRLGPVGLALRETDASTRARVIETVRAAFEPYVHGATVRYTAACWMITARTSAPSQSAGETAHD